MKKRLILVGNAAAGKDHARKICEQWLDLPYQVSYTTRPPRNEETNGFDYFFIENSKFKEMIKEESWYEYVVFNGWYYGTTKEQFYTEGSVFIMTPTGLSNVSKQDRKESLVIYLNINEEIRKTRMHERAGNADSVERRILADRKDFKDFTDYDVQINNPYFDTKDIAELTHKYMGINIPKVFLQN